FLSDGETRLTYDRERTDQYGRALAYVWVGDRLLNEELLLRGLARWEAHYNYAEPMKARFRRAQREAQREKVGIWSLPAPRPPAGILCPPCSVVRIGLLPPLLALARRCPRTAAANVLSPPQTEVRL